MPERGVYSSIPVPHISLEEYRKYVRSGQKKYNKWLPLSLIGALTIAFSSWYSTQNADAQTAPIVSEPKPVPTISSSTDTTSIKWVDGTPILFVNNLPATPVPTSEYLILPEIVPDLSELSGIPVLGGDKLIGENCKNIVSLALVFDSNGYRNNPFPITSDSDILGALNVLKGRKLEWYGYPEANETPIWGVNAGTDIMPYSKDLIALLIANRDQGPEFYINFYKSKENRYSAWLLRTEVTGAEIGRAGNHPPGGCSPIELDHMSVEIFLAALQKSL